MTHEEPRIMFFHYWGRGAAKDLAQAVKGGLLVGGLLEVSSPLKADVPPETNRSPSGAKAEDRLLREQSQ